MRIDICYIVSNATIARADALAFIIIQDKRAGACSIVLRRTPIPVVILAGHNVESDFGVGLFPCGTVNNTEPFLGGNVLEINLTISSIVLNIEHLLEICFVIGNLCDTVFIRSNYETARHASSVGVILSDEIVVAVNERIAFCVDNSFSCSQSSQLVGYLRLGFACSMCSLDYIKGGL